jgi:hypothetical protein
MNGGNVFVRREFTGWFVTTSGNTFTNAQTVYIYSRKKRTIHNRSSFLPIDDNHEYTSRIVPNLLLKCFDMYFRLNKELDFLSLVFSLNNATETGGLDEKYYILITALEKICFNFAKNIRPGKKTLIDNTFFSSTIKKELEATIKKYEQDIKMTTLPLGLYSNQNWVA